MYIYFLLLIFWFFCNLLLTPLSRKQNRLIFVMIAGSTLFLVMALRDKSVGTDTANYLLHNLGNQLYLYDEIINTREWGFRAIFLTYDRIGIGNQGAIALFSLFICFSFSFLYYKYSKNVFLSFYLHVTIGLFAISMSGWRQISAVCICIFAFEMMKNRKLILFIILVYTAYLFHESALCFIPIYFLSYISKLKCRKQKKIVIFSITALFILTFLVTYLMPLVNLVIPERYSILYDIREDQAPTNPLLVMSFIAIPTVCYIFWNKLDIEDELFFYLFCLSIACALCSILSLGHHIFGRLGFYYAPFNMLLIPNIITRIKNAQIRLVAYFFCLLLPLIQFIESLPGSTLKIDNYIFFWEVLP